MQGTFMLKYKVQFLKKHQCDMSDAQTQISSATV